MVNLSVNSEQNEHQGNIIISVSTNESWAIKSIQIYVGDPSGIPVNPEGEMDAGNFPANISFPAYQTSYSAEFAPNVTGSIPYCVVAIHVAIDRFNKNGKVIQSEEAWIDGIRLVEKGSWATFYTYYLMPCSVPPAAN